MVEEVVAAGERRTLICDVDADVVECDVFDTGEGEVVVSRDQAEAKGFEPVNRVEVERIRFPKTGDGELVTLWSDDKDGLNMSW